MEKKWKAMPSGIKVKKAEKDTCWICGKKIDALVIPFLREKGVCSNYCLTDAGWDYS